MDMKRGLTWSSGTSPSSLSALASTMIMSCVICGIIEYFNHFLSTFDSQRSNKFNTRCQLWLIKLIRSSLHAVAAIFTYLIMILLMTYSLWVVSSMLVGAGLGHLFLGPLLGARHEKLVDEKSPDRDELVARNSHGESSSEAPKFETPV